MATELTAQQKRALREQAKTTLAAISDRERELRSRSLCSKLADLPGWSAAKTVMVYLAMPEEVDLAAAIEKAVKAGKRICVPRIDWAAKTMSPMVVDWKKMKTEVREHGVSEPVGGAVAKLEKLDLVLVPGLAFDLKGHRLGRGAGFYDRFLEEYKAARGPAAAALGVCFEAQVVGQIPAEEHDQTVDGVVTERRLVLCRKPAPQADKKRSRKH